MVSGRDYERAGLATKQFGAKELSPDAASPANAEPRAAASDSTSSQETTTGGATGPPGVDPALSRLAAPPALQACLDAIMAAHGHAITSDSVDFARFEGTPALIVQFTSAAGSWAWVSGPECGTPGVGADTRYKVKVG
jgi:hypothetical protein